MSRRKITTAVTMLVLCGLLVVGAVLGWKALSADFAAGQKAASEPEPSCTTERTRAGDKLRSSQVRVSVFNGGSRDGLADDTMAALHKRGFRVGDVGNAPSDAQVERVAVWSTEGDDDEARLVARQFGKKLDVVFADVDLGPGVDVIVGDGFRKLVKARHSIKVTSSQQVCVRSNSADAAG